MVVHDIDPPKMQEIRDKVQKELEEYAGAYFLHFFRTTTNDNLCSSVKITGSFDKKEDWSGGIFHNSHYFIIWIFPEKGKRYYTPGEKVTVELDACSHKLPNTKLRKYTGPVEKVIAKILSWIESQNHGTMTL